MKGRVYKFMAGEQYHLKALDANQVYFSKFTELNDPYEGLLHFNEEGVTDSLRMALLANGLASESSVSLSEGRKKAERLVKSKGVGAMRSLVTKWTKVFFEDYMKYHLEERFVLSLSLQAEANEFPSPLNNMMMWSHYAKGMRGFCVEYDYDLLLQSIERLNNGVRISTRIVDYSKKKLPVVNATTVMEAHMDDDGKAGTEMIEAFCTKYIGWKYENELRLIGSQHGLVSFDESAIKRVFVSANNTKLKDEIISKLSSKSMKIPLYEVHIREKTYGFGFSPVDY